MASSSEEPTSGFEEARGRRGGEHVFKGRTLLPGQHRPGIEARSAPGITAAGAQAGSAREPGWAPMHQPRHASPRTRLLLEAQAQQPASLLPRELLLRLHFPPAPAPTGNSPGSESGRPAHLVQGSFLPETPVSLLPPLLTRGPRGATRAPRPDPHPSGRQAGRLVVQPLLPESGRGGGVSACLATKRPGNRDAPGTL